MDYKDLLFQNRLLSSEERSQVLDLIRYFQAKAYTYKEAHRIMELADFTMQRAVQMRKI